MIHNKTSYVWNRINSLKQEITDDIKLLLTQNSLTELNLPVDVENDERAWFIWDDDGTLHDSPVDKVYIENGKILIYISDLIEPLATTLDEDDLSHYHLGCLCNLLNSVTETLKSNQNVTS